jgi:hypothetical protein
MTRQEATSRTIDLLIMNSNITRELAEYLADKIYADVVALAVDDVRDVYTEIIARKPEAVQ